jgi:hypothetical protein
VISGFITIVFMVLIPRLFCSFGLGDVFPIFMFGDSDLKLSSCFPNFHVYNGYMKVHACRIGS